MSLNYLYLPILLTPMKLRDRRTITLNTIIIVKFFLSNKKRFYLSKRLFLSRISANSQSFRFPLAKIKIMR